MEIVFTMHAEYRILKRNILKQEVIEAIRYPDLTFKKHGKYYYKKAMDRGKIEVVCEKTENNIKVVTLYWV